MYILKKAVSKEIIEKKITIWTEKYSLDGFLPLTGIEVRCRVSTKVCKNFPLKKFSDMAKKNWTNEFNFHFGYQLSNVFWSKSG